MPNLDVLHLEFVFHDAYHSVTEKEAHRHFERRLDDPQVPPLIVENVKACARQWSPVEVERFDLFRADVADRADWATGATESLWLKPFSTNG